MKFRKMVLGLWPLVFARNSSLNDEAQAEPNIKAQSPKTNP
jgi:hypothetical protein